VVICTQTVNKNTFNGQNQFKDQNECSVGAGMAWGSGVRINVVLNKASK
jgi:hypothetical protein